MQTIISDVNNFSLRATPTQASIDHLSAPWSLYFAHSRNALALLIFRRENDPALLFHMLVVLFRQNIG